MTDPDNQDFNNIDEYSEESKYGKTKTKLTKWKEEPTVQDLKEDMQAAQPFHDTHVSRVRDWLDNLHVTGSAKPPAVKGRSQMQPMLIRKQNEWRYPALSEPFLSNQDLFRATPVTHEDVDSAKQNELVLNSQFRTKMNFTAFIDTYARTFVDEGTAILRTGWERVEEEVTEQVEQFDYKEDNSMEAMQYMAQNLATYQADPQAFSDAPPELIRSLQLSQLANTPMMPVSTGFKNVTSLKVTKNHPTVEVCDYNDVIIDPSCEGDLKKAKFIVFRFPTSLSDLKSTGRYKNLDDINIEGKSPGEMSDDSYADTTEEKEAASTFSFKDEARKQFYAYEYWGYRDVEGDDSLTPILATWVDDVLIGMEESPMPLGDLPFVAVPYLPVKKSVYGEPAGLLIQDNQKVIGAVTRGMIDIMARGANGQVGTRKDALDPVNKRKRERGEDYEFNAQVNAQDAIYMHTYDNIPTSAEYMLNLNKAEAAEMTGTRPFGATDPTAGKSTATADRSSLDAASKMETAILRRMAYGLVEVGRKFIAMNSEFLEEEEIIRITNDEFVPVRRDDLEGRVDLTLSITTAEEDNAKAQELAFMAQTTTSVMGPEFAKKVLSKIAALRKMPDLAKEIEEYEPQPDPLQQQIQQLELQKLQAEIEEIKSRTVENYAEAELDKAKAGAAQSDKDIKDLDFIEREAGISHARDVDKITSQAKSQGELKVLESQLKGYQQSQGTPDS